MIKDLSKTRPKTKAQIRDELERQVDSYLNSGGEVKKIPNGISGRDSNINIFSQVTHFEPKKERTSLNDIVKEIEARKKSKTMKLKKISKAPRKKLITDDFGEPIRWVWDE